VLAVLEHDPGDTQLAALRTLSRLPMLPPRLRPAVERLARQSPSWPTRMWAARALHDEARGLVGEASGPKSTPTSEPVALVRAAAHTDWGGEAPAPRACEAREPATN
jgi:hypothetical protein